MNPNFPEPAPPAKSGLKFRHIAILLLLAFVGGIGLTGWLVSEYDIFDRSILATTSPKPTVVVPETSAVNASIQNIAADDAQIDGLENRLSEISQDAQAASGNANRAETMMIAFAARRAIEAGTPLGAIQGQLEQRFGAQAPNAVSQILSAAIRPVTLSALQTEFAGFGDSLLQATNDQGLWSDVGREMRELFVLRRGARAQNDPSVRMERARNLVGNADIASAIDQIAPMPGAARAQIWLQKARSYVATRLALDAIERAALASVTIVPRVAPQLSDPAVSHPPLSNPAPANPTPQTLPNAPAEPVE
jgi:hypothetical protein